MLHPRAFKASVVWTLGLLFLGSVVHATESSLACPDWPTCFGSMVPEMTGGVFWEHLHRLVAGGLLLLWGLGTWLARRETGDRPWVFRASLAGMGLLVVQSVFGGLTVIYRLPDLVSTTHLTLAFGFLGLATVLATATHGAGGRVGGSVSGSAPAPLSGFGPGVGARLRTFSAATAVLVFVQSVVGALVRHTDGGLSCPDIPLCLGQVVPPLVNIQIQSHFLHRVMALVATAAVFALWAWLRRAPAPRWAHRLAWTAVGLVTLQVALGVTSVLTFLAVSPVSLHTLVAALLLVVLTVLATAGGRTEDTQALGTSEPLARATA